MTYRDFKNLPRKTTSDKVVRDKAFNFAKNSKYVGYQRGLAAKIYKFFVKNSSGANISSGAIKSEIMSNKQLAEKLHKPINRKFDKRKVCSSLDI